MSDLDARTALTLVRTIRDPASFGLVLRDVVRRVREQPADMVIWNEMKLLADAQKADELRVLRDTAGSLEEELDITKLCVDRAVSQDGETALHIRQALDALLVTLPKICAKSFASEMPRLLGVHSWDFEQELCEALWVVGDEAAEAGLVQIMRQLDYSSQDHAIWIRLDNLVKALGTCGTRRCVSEVLDYLRMNPMHTVDLYREAIVPLINRGVLRTVDLASIADDTQAQSPGRITCLLALHEAGCQEPSGQLERLALDPTDAGVQRIALSLLSLSGTDAARSTIRAAYDKTPHDAVRAEAAEGLGRLGDAEFVERLQLDLIDRYISTEYAAHYVIGLTALENPSSIPPILRCLHVNRFINVQHTIVSHLGVFLSDERVQAVLDDYLSRWLGPRTDYGEQSLPLNLLAVTNPQALVTRALGLYRLGVLADRARETLACIVGWLDPSLDLMEDAQFLELMKRLTSDAHLSVREIAGAALSSMSPDFCSHLFDVLWRGDSEWSRSCATRTLAYWGNEETLLDSRHHEDLLVRHAADVALELRKRGAITRDAIKDFAALAGVKRLAQYYLIREHGDERAIRCLLISDEPTISLHRAELIKSLIKRLEDERKKRSDEEKKMLQERGSVIL